MVSLFDIIGPFMVRPPSHRGRAGQPGLFPVETLPVAPA